MHKTDQPEGEYIFDIEFEYTVKGVVTCTRADTNVEAATKWVEDAENHSEVLAAATKYTANMTAKLV